jgi:hypothetical protein
MSSTQCLQASSQILSPELPSFFGKPVDFQAALNSECGDGGQTYSPEQPPFFGGQPVGFQPTINPDCDDRGRAHHHHHHCHGDPQGDPLTVNGNTVNTGRYTITASTGDGGTLTVTDNTTGESFKVSGDPHITTDKGDTTSFQHAPATFMLPDGTQITVDPTHNSGVNYINNVTITKGNDAVEMTGFHTGNLQTQALPGEGYYLDATTPEGTVLTAENGNIDQLELPNGTLISGNNVKNIDSYANEGGSWGQSNGQFYQLEQQIVELEQEVVQLEEQIMQMEFMNMNPLGFMSNPLEDSSFG